ncbi:oligosaccharide flippase family protein [Candidatus Peregrinibacteria bacterium]|jgi:O-antigen/teichoic acid export membrane protein|nr:oligosaccharide flippase family protein [Candidatus Peregrinibacteria bacterium]
MNLNLHFKNTLWLYLSSFLVLPIAYFIRVLYAQELTVADYGIFYGLFGFFAFFNFLRDWGINDASTYFVNKFLIEKNHSKIKTIFYFNHFFQLFLSILIAVALYYFNDVIFETFYKGELHIKPIFNLFILLWITDTIVATNRKFLDIFQDQKANTFFNLTLFSLIITLSLIAFYSTYINSFEIPTLAYLGAYLTISIFSFLYLLIKYKEYFISPSFYLDLGFFKKISKYSTSLLIAGFSGMVFTTTDIVIIQYFEGAESVAFYSTAVSSAILLTVLISPINRVIAPLTAKLWHSRKKTAISDILSFALNNFWALIVPLAALFAILSDNFILAVYGEKFMEASILLKYLSLGIIIYSINTILPALVNSIGKPKDLSRIILTIGLINFIGNLLVIQFLGTLGVVFVTIFSYFVGFALFVRVLSSEIKIRFDLMNFFKILFSSGIFIVVAMLLVKNLYIRYLNIEMLDFIINGGIVLMISSIFYVVALVATGVITKAKLQHLKQLLLSE